MRICRFCGKVFNRHGNSRHCDDYCGKQARSLRQKNQYHNRQRIIHEIDHAQKILATYFNLYGFEKYISSIQLERDGFNWSVKTGKCKIEGYDAIKVGDYGYVIFKNQTLRIWKINN